MSSSVVASTSATASAAASSKGHGHTINVHLTVFVHGLWGDPSHVQVLARGLAKAHGGELSPASAKDSKDKTESNGKPKTKKQLKKEAEKQKDKEKEEAQVQKVLDDVQQVDAPEPGWKLVVLNTVSNRWLNTYDGIDLCAERVVREIKAEIERIEETDGDEHMQVRRFTIVGYSLGGLISRYVLAVLWSQGFFTTSPEGAIATAGRPVPQRSIEPVSFYTFATPHIGIPPANSSSGKLANYIGGKILSRTGLQLYNMDDDWGRHAESQPLHDHTETDKRGLLEAMSEPGSVFMRALGSFAHFTIYANGLSDRTVPYRTGAIEYDDPFLLKGTKVVTMEAYPKLVASYAPQAELPKDERGFMRRARDSLIPTSVPIMLRPSRYPFKPPFNYLAILGLPVLLPALLCVLLVRNRGQGKQSRKRIEEEEARWREEQELSDEGEDARPASRVQRMLNAASKVAEDVAEGSTDVAEPRRLRRRDTETAQEEANTRLDGKPLTENSDSYPGTTLAPLTAKQKLMVKNLNALPNLSKRITYFQDVLNSHGIIICRPMQNDMMFMGKDVVRHFAQHFDL